MIWPTRGGYIVVAVLIDPNPETIGKPGWEQVPLAPLGRTHVGAVSGSEVLGLFKYVRLNTFVNSARRFMVILSRIRKIRLRPMFSTGRRSWRKKACGAWIPIISTSIWFTAPTR